jgi:hypothetical protein
VEKWKNVLEEIQVFDKTQPEYWVYGVSIFSHLIREELRVRVRKRREPEVINIIFNDGKEKVKVETVRLPPEMPIALGTMIFPPIPSGEKAGEKWLQPVVEEFGGDLGPLKPSIVKVPSLDQLQKIFKVVSRTLN